jgi:hypothetical protein
MAAPTFVASYDSGWGNSTSPKTVAVTTQAQDRVVVVGGSEDSADTLNTPTGNGITFSLAQSIVISNFCTAYAWTGTDGTGGTNWTASVSHNGGASRWFGYTVFVLRASDGFGASAQANNASGAPSVNLTTQQANSAVLCLNTDWSATDGASRTWRTVNGITPTAGNALERLYFRDSVRYTAYNAYWSDAGAAGSNAYGLSAPGAQAYAVIALEVKGTAGAATVGQMFRRAAHRGLVLRGRRAA